MGHILGDIAIKTIAKCIKSATRTIDNIGRIGGDEFCVILPHTNVKSAILIAKNILLFISNTKINHTKKNISVSIGITYYYPQIKTESNISINIKIIETANKALQLAKKSGKNCIFYCKIIK
jgi:diguanylate cyclase (GGDEF)-like protein